MNRPEADYQPAVQADSHRRAAVLDSALLTFARFGYRKTSMEEVARAARISRPGLYFLFSSKELLFRAAVTQALNRDIAAVEEVLHRTDEPLRARLLDSFDQWAGRYIGPLTADVEGVIADNPDLLGAIVEIAPRRFEELIAGAILTASEPASAAARAQTMISTSIGIKHQVTSRRAYRERLEVAVDLLLR